MKKEDLIQLLCILRSQELDLCDVYRGIDGDFSKGKINEHLAVAQAYGRVIDLLQGVDKC